MKKKGILLSFIFIIILINQFLIINAIDSSTSNTITSTIGEEKALFEGVVYEIGENVLDTGYEISMKEKDAIKMMISGQNYHLILENIGENSVYFVTFGGKNLTLNLNETFFIGIGSDNTPDLEIILNSIKKDTANIFIKTYNEQEFIPGNYKELFDITVDLVNDKIENARDLTIYIKFINFGEGASKINIVYSIFDWNGREVYRGIDEKVVYTEESLIKNFDFLDLSPGKYIINSQIFYGDNQTAVSERNFEIVEPAIFSKLISFIILLTLVIGFYIFIRLSVEKREKKEHGKRNH